MRSEISCFPGLGWPRGALAVGASSASAVGNGDLGAGARRSLLRGRRGFTLVELLVVMAVLALLAALLAPTLARCRRAAQRRVCATNLYQIGLALGMYLDDNDGVFPIGAYRHGLSRYQWNVSWHNELNGNLRSRKLLFCPLAAPGSSYRTSYGCNPWISRWWRAIGLAQVDAPDQTVYAAEKADHDWCAYPPSARAWRAYKPLAARHDDSLLLLFCDGHVRALPLTQAEGPGARWWPRLEAPVPARTTLRAVPPGRHFAGFRAQRSGPTMVHHGWRCPWGTDDQPEPLYSRSEKR